MPERKAKQKDELKLMDKVKVRVEATNVQNLLDTVNTEWLKTNLKSVIKIINKRIKNLKFLAVKEKKRHLEHPVEKNE